MTSVTKSHGSESEGYWWLLFI